MEPRKKKEKFVGGVIYVCSRCGHVLLEVKDDIKPVDEVLEMFDYKCPRCGREFDMPPRRVDAIIKGGKKETLYELKQ